MRSPVIDRVNEPVFYSVIASPVGELLLTGNGSAITGLYMDWHTRGPYPDPEWRQEDEPLSAAREQLAAYFAGELLAFDLPLAARGTSFQQRVWTALRTIPYGAHSPRGIGRPDAPP